MKTMGLHQLVLVNPARFPDPQADWRAAGAMDVLDGAQVVSEVSAAVADCHYVWERVHGLGLFLGLRC